MSFLTPPVFSWTGCEPYLGEGQDLGVGIDSPPSTGSGPGVSPGSSPNSSSGSISQGGWQWGVGAWTTPVGQRDLCGQGLGLVPVGVS